MNQLIIYSFNKKNKLIMKYNKIRKIAVAVVIMIAGGLGIYSSYVQNRVEMSDIALANVEALASNEGTGACYGYGSVLCTYMYRQD